MAFVPFVEDLCLLAFRACANFHRIIAGMEMLSEYKFLVSVSAARHINTKPLRRPRISTLFDLIQAIPQLSVKPQEHQLSECFPAPMSFKNVRY